LAEGSFHQFVQDGLAVGADSTRVLECAQFENLPLLSQYLISCHWFQTQFNLSYLRFDLFLFVNFLCRLLMRALPTAMSADGLLQVKVSLSKAFCPSSRITVTAMLRTKM
jgi:hypothetical protein